MQRNYYLVDRLSKFIRKIAIDYLRYGYTRYAVRLIPEGKDLEKVDQTIITSYGVLFCRSARARQRAKGLANVVYLRFGQRFILLANQGKHPEVEKRDFKNFLDHELYIDGYTIGVKRNKPCVMVAPRRFRSIRKYALKIALYNKQRLTTFLQNISPFSYPGINEQKWKLFLAVNKLRKRAGLARIEWEEAKKPKNWRKKYN
ncbi:MAG: hypothetical protein F6J89_02065 [Symploca sp. SIO1C4]|uniref:Uncharacterized protein n=1 Tax=Symploca sp. SIO1C4 TaxID=2607765 RepID=A0A6B3MYD6_9CYAN|nr:hypothetical protein [Symploca sp. SIO1C4]